MSNVEFTGIQQALENPEMLSFNSGALVKCSEIIANQPIVKEIISKCEEKVGEAISTVASDVINSISDFCKGVYSDVKDFLGDTTESQATELPSQVANEIKGVVSEFEPREFGISDCSEAAKEIFTPSVIKEWPNMSIGQRKALAYSYANEVAKAFQLEYFKGVYIEHLDGGVLGYNNGDGTIHLDESLVSGQESPFEIMNTITHELRHQYQSEAIKGFHNVPEDVIKEWSVAQSIYNYNSPSAYDPWGYTYNPLEIDARFAGESVVKNVSNSIINQNA